MPGNSTEPIKRRHILIIDDDDLMNVLYKSLFDQHKDEFDSRFSDSAKNALEDIRRRWPDALVLDWDMPKISGLNLLKALRRDPVAKTIRVLVVSGRAGVEDQVLALDGGADDYLSKPFDVRVFIARLRALVRRWN